MGILIGSDPEVFVADSNGPSIAVGKIGGTKEHPMAVPNGAVQEDNVLAEFNTDPASTADEFVSAVTSVLGTLSGIAAKVGLSLDMRSSHVFQPEQIEAGGKQAVVFGCDPDFNAYTMTQNIMPRGVDPMLRTAGGHVHIGYDNPDAVTSADIAVACDVLLGLPSVILDTDTRRRERYGKAGAFRIKPYGVEYRTLSNFWLRDEALMRWVYDAATQAATSTDELTAIAEDIGVDEIQRIINESDVAAASDAVAKYNIYVPEV